MGNLLVFLSFRNSSPFHLKYLELFLTMLLSSIIQTVLFAPHIFAILIIENLYFKQYDLLVQGIGSLKDFMFFSLELVFLMIFTK